MGENAAFSETDIVRARIEAALISFERWLAANRRAGSGNTTAATMR